MFDCEDRKELRSIHTLLRELVSQIRKIMATQQELAVQLTTATDQLKKIGGETKTLLQKVDELTAIINAGGPVSPELQSAADALTAQAKVVDDLVPDQVP